MKVAVIGTGYVGLVTGTCLADLGNLVVCVDIDSQKIEKLNSGIIPIYEPGLEELVVQNSAHGLLEFSDDISVAIKGCDVVFIAVGTPQDEDGSADLHYVLQVAESIGRHMNGYLLVIDKSTVPVGTADKVRETIQRELDAREEPFEFDVASNPEFLKEGSAINDFMHPDRVVIGVDSYRSHTILKRLYDPIVNNGSDLIAMDIKSAEMTKYAANAMLAARIAFMNELAGLCELVDANINSVKMGIGSDTRIGHKFLNPGIGYGGSCFPKDVKALINTAYNNTYDLSILRAVDKANNFQKFVLAHKVIEYFAGDLTGLNIAIWGLSFKPDTDDMREAPAIDVITTLLIRNAKISAYDPQATNEAKRKFEDLIEYCVDKYDALKDADCLLVLTEWNEFKEPNFDLMRSKMRRPIVFDGRNIYDRAVMKHENFDYHCIGIKYKG